MRKTAYYILVVIFGLSAVAYLLDLAINGYTNFKLWGELFEWIFLPIGFVAILLSDRINTFFNKVKSEICKNKWETNIHSDIQGVSTSFSSETQDIGNDINNIKDAKKRTYYQSNHFKRIIVWLKHIINQIVTLTS